MNKQLTNRYIITGGPGLGKSSVITVLKEMGYATHLEVARSIIREWRQRGAPSPSPWADRTAFDNEIEQRMLWQYVNTDKSRPTIFDRGLPDLIAWKVHLGHSVASRLREVVVAHPYEHMVFITPPWAPWYQPDMDRPFSKEESYRINGLLEETYEQLGYTVLELPRLGIRERAAFVAKTIVARSMGAE